MAKTILVASGKGGAGKSSLAVGIAAAYGLRGKKSLIVELDAGLRGLDLMLGVSDEIVYDLGDVLSGRTGLSDAVISTGPEGLLHYLPALASAQAGMDLAAFGQCIHSWKQQYDILLLDLPAGLNPGIFARNDIADMAVIVTTPDPVCIRGGEKIAMLAEERGFADYRLLINRVSRASMRRSCVKDLDEVIDGVGAPLLGVVEEDQNFRFALSHGAQLDSKSRTMQILGAVSRRIDGEYVPLVLTRLSIT